MRRPFLFGLLIIITLTIIVWVVSYYLQPILQPETNKALNLFFQALIGVTGVLGVVGFFEFINNKFWKNKSEIKEGFKITSRNDQSYKKANKYTENVEIQTGDISVEGGTSNISGKDIIQ